MNKVRKPEIARNQDMVGIRIQCTEELVDARTAINLGQALVTLGERLDRVHQSALEDAEVMDFPNTTHGDNQVAKFIRESMTERLGLNGVPTAQA